MLQLTSIRLMLTTLCVVLITGSGLAQVVVDFGSRTSTVAKSIPPRILSSYLAHPAYVGSTQITQLQQAGYGEIRTDATLESIFANGSTPNWTYIDSVIGRLKSAGIRTMIVMGYTPAWLQPNPNPCPADGYGPNRAAPTDITRWAQLTAEFVNHVDRTFPGYVTDYEIWDLPELDDGLCTAGDTDTVRRNTYVAMFAAAASAMRQRAAQDGFPAIRIGGPVIGLLSSAWFTQLLNDAVASQNINFVSYHKFLGFQHPGMTWDGAGGTPSLRQMTQDPSTGFAATFKYVSSLVKQGKQPNPSSTPIFVTEYNDNGGYINDCCRNSPVYSPLFNTMAVADMLGTIYSGAQNVPGNLGYLSVSSPSGAYCLFGVIDSTMDCSIHGTLQPYPQYYTYKLLGAPGYLNLNGGGKMAVSVAPAIGTTGLVVSGFYTSKGDAIVITNPSAADATNVTITAKNPGTTHTLVNRYLLNSSNQFITSSTVTFTVISGGLQYTTTIPHYSVMAFLLQ